MALASSCMDYTLQSAAITSSSKSFSSPARAQLACEGLRVKPLSLRGNKWSSSFSATKSARNTSLTVVKNGLFDYLHSDLLRLDRATWIADVEKYGAVGFYAPPEGGAEGKYATALKNQGYRLMNVSARGLGDPEAYLTKIHGVRPPHLGKQVVARWYIPPEVDYKLSLLHKDDKGLLVWVGEAKVLSKNELQFFALLPILRPNVKVVMELGSARKFEWKPLKDVCGLPAARVAEAAESALEPSKVPAETA